MSLELNVNEDDGPDDDTDDEELDQLVRNIFEIIPSYAIEERLLAVRRAIHEYVVRKLRQRQ